MSVRKAPMATTGLQDNVRSTARRQRTAPAPRWSGQDGYSGFVSLLKRALPLAAFCLITLMIFWQDLVPSGRLLAPDVSELSPELAKDVAMVRPRYDGIDDKGRPYSVTAERATQAEDGDQVIHLERLAADITLEDGAWVSLQADTGRYDRKVETLRLDGNVTLYHDQGLEMHSPSANIDLKNGEAVGTDGLQGLGPQGRLSAEGFRLTDGGKTIFFTGRSNLIVEDNAARDGSFAGIGG